MAKIQFDIKFRPQIESGEYKVKTRDGKKVRVLCYDANNITPVVALVTFNDGSEGSRDYYFDGTMNFDRENPLDLFIITPEPEMSELELAIAKYRPPTDSKETIQRIAAELLSLARKQLQPEIDAEIEKAYKTADEVQYRKGREEALKDLPRWKPSNCPRSNLPSLYLTGDGTALYKDGYEIALSDLEKLPKED